MLCDYLASTNTVFLPKLRHAGCHQWLAFPFFLNDQRRPQDGCEACQVNNEVPSSSDTKVRSTSTVPTSEFAKFQLHPKTFDDRRRS
jgi:hypothetical protein